MGVFVDSSAALGVVKRKGNGKMGHIRIGFLSVQEKSEIEEIYYSKVKGTENPADLMTKYLCLRAMELYMYKLGVIWKAGAT